MAQTTASPGPVAPPPAPPPPRQGLIMQPDWLRRPDGADLAELYPPSAGERSLTAHTKMICVVTETGTLTNCELTEERPRGYGFGRAALQASRYFKMRPRTVAGTPVAGARVAIPMNWTVEDGMHHKIVVESPGVETAPTSNRDWEADYPSEVQASGVEGVVWVRATVGVDGRAGAISIRESSRAPELDAAAMRAVADWEFQPARDAAGQPMAATIAVKFRFEPLDFMAVRCATLTAQAAWVDRAWPERGISRFSLYREGRSYSLAILDPKARAASGEAWYNHVYDVAFRRTVETCAERPAARVADVLAESLRRARD